MIIEIPLDIVIIATKNAPSFHSAQLELGVIFSTMTVYLQHIRERKLCNYTTPRQLDTNR